jgi:hypothetical protein
MLLRNLEKNDSFIHLPVPPELGCVLVKEKSLIFMPYFTFIPEEAGCEAGFCGMNTTLVILDCQ